jgi:subtilisin family serine protease
MRFAIAILGLVIASAAAAQATAAADTPARLTLRLLPTADLALQSKLFKRLIELAKPTLVRLPPGVAVDDLLRQRCGFVSAPLRAALLVQNPGLDAALQQQERRDIVLPPCPYWQFSVPVEVAGEQSLNRAMSIATGFAGPQTTAQVVARNPQAFDVHSKLVTVAQQALVLPHRSQPFTLFLRDAAGSPAEVADRLATEFPGLLKTSLITENALPDAIKLSKAVPAAAAGNCTGRAGAWPYDPDRLAAALESNKRLRKPGGNYPKTTIVVADTGLRFAETSQLPLWTNPRESDPHSSEHVDEDGNGFEDDLHGAYMNKRFGFPEPIPEYEESEHGTQVVGMIFGPSANEGLKALLRERIEISIAGLVYRDVLGAEPAGEFQGQPRVFVHVPGDSIVRAFNYAETMLPEPVLNVSFSSRSDLPGLEAVLRGARFLTVVAAGNDGEPIGQVGKQSYPPEWRRKYAEAMLIVAAHDGAGRLAQFSNHGRDVVDLSAPGCMLPTTGFDERTVTAWGTSMAAPLVSLTAALLKAEGLLRPAEIRNRILATTDFDPNLKDLYSSGRLNIEKALRIYEGIVVTRHADGTSGEAQFGELSAAGPLRLCGDRIPLRDIVKLIPRYSDGPSPMRLLRRSGPHLVPADCADAPDLRLSFRPEASQTARELRLDEISELIPALR